MIVDWIVSVSTIKEFTGLQNKMLVIYNIRQNCNWTFTHMIFTMWQYHMKWKYYVNTWRCFSNWQRIKSKRSGIVPVWQHGDSCCGVSDKLQLEILCAKSIKKIESWLPATTSRPSQTSSTVILGNLVIEYFEKSNRFENFLKVRSDTLFQKELNTTSK